MNKQLIVLMKSKAILEQGFNRIRQTRFGTDAQDITTDTYVTLFTELFESVSNDVRLDLREKLSAVLNEDTDSWLTFELPLKMKKRDTKVFEKKDALAQSKAES